MPIYEYRCKKCGHTYEVIQKFTDPPRRKCPECGGAVEKLVSRTSFQLKGGGWFKSDYSKSSAAPSSSDSAKKESKKEKKEPSKAKASGSD